MKRILSGFLLFLCLFGLFGCKGKNSRAVGTAAGHEILYDELRYMTLSVRDRLEETYGDGIWNDPAIADAHRAELEAEVLSGLARDYAVLAAAQIYLPARSLDDADVQSAVDAAIKELTETLGGKKEYKKYLSEVYMTDRLMRFSLAKAELENALSDTLFAGTELENDAVFSAWLTGGNFVRVKKIESADRAVIETVRNDLLAGKTPDEAVAETGATLTSAFYLVRGFVDDPTLEEDAFALEAVGNVGQIRETDSGYRVLIRMEDNAEAFLANQANSYRKKLRTVRADAILSGIEASVSVALNDYGKSLDLLKIK